MQRLAFTRSHVIRVFSLADPRLNDPILACNRDTSCHAHVHYPSLKVTPKVSFGCKSDSQSDSKSDSESDSKTDFLFQMWPLEWLWESIFGIKSHAWSQFRSQLWNHFGNHRNLLYGSHFCSFLLISQAPRNHQKSHIFSQISYLVESEFQVLKQNTTLRTFLMSFRLHLSAECATLCPVVPR